MSYNKNFFDKIDTPSKAYFLGLSLADATIRKTWYDKYNKFYYEYSFNPHISDRLILDRFCNEIGGEVKHKTSYTNKRKEPYENAIISFKNKHLVETLGDNFGGFLKPQRIKYDVPKELLSHFIRGYFDGDGSLSLSNSWELAMNGNEHILQKISQDIGLTNNITNDKSTKRLRMRSKNDIKDFLLFIYSDIDVSEELPLFLWRKYQKANEFLLATSKTSGKIGED